MLVDGVVYFRIHCPISSVANVSNANSSTRLLAQTTLRNVLGTKNLSEVLSDREGISLSMQVRSHCALMMLMTLSGVLEVRINQRNELNRTWVLSSSILG